MKRKTTRICSSEQCVALLLCGWKMKILRRVLWLQALSCSVRGSTQEDSLKYYDMKEHHYHYIVIRYIRLAPSSAQQQWAASMWRSASVENEKFKDFCFFSFSPSPTCYFHHLSLNHWKREISFYKLRVARSGNEAFSSVAEGGSGED